MALGSVRGREARTARQLAVRYHTFPTGLPGLGRLICDQQKGQLDLSVLPF